MDSNSAAVGSGPVTVYNTLNHIVDTTDEDFSLRQAAAEHTGLVLHIDDKEVGNSGRSVVRRDLNSSQICSAMSPGPTDTNAFLLHNLLSPHECGYIMKYAAPHMRPMDAQYAQKHRKADRAMFRSKAMARELFGRILPMLVERDYKQRTPLCFGHDGVWRPFGLNECLKVFRYGVGGEFVEHRDGPWVPREDQCSMYTVVLYLNEDLEGGSTVLIGCGDASGDRSPQGSRGRAFGATEFGTTVKPSTGSALIFNHECWHAGDPVKLGCKWILRTEIIFQRIHTFYVDRVAFASDEGYLAARELYASSMRAMEEGRREEFFEQYARVVGLQREAMLQVERSKQPQMLSRLDHDTFAHVLSFLSDAAIKALLTVNRKSFAAVVTSPHWQAKWETQIKANNSLRGARRLEDGAFDHYKALRAQDPSNSPVPLALTGGDYFTLYRQQLHLKKSFRPAVLILTDPGAVFVSPTDMPSDTTKYKYATRSKFASTTVVSKRLRLSVTHPWHGVWQWASPLHMNTPCSERCIMGAEKGEYDFLRRGRVIDPFTGKPEWSVLTVPIDVAVEPHKVPLLIVPHPAWSAETEEANAVDALEAAFGLLRSPAVAMCHPAVCAMVGCFDLSVDVDGELDPDRTTTVIFVSEQGVHSFVVRDRTFAIVEQEHFTAPVRKEPFRTSLDSAQIFMLPPVKEVLEALKNQLSAASTNGRMLLFVNQNIRSSIGDELEVACQPYNTSLKIVNSAMFTLGASRLMHCPSFRQKCFFRM